MLYDVFHPISNSFLNTTPSGQFTFYHNHTISSGICYCKSSVQQYQQDLIVLMSPYSEGKPKFVELWTWGSYILHAFTVLPLAVRLYMLYFYIWSSFKKGNDFLAVVENILYYRWYLIWPHSSSRTLSCDHVIEVHFYNFFYNFMKWLGTRWDRI